MFTRLRQEHESVVNTGNMENPLVKGLWIEYTNVRQYKRTTYQVSMGATLEFEVPLVEQMSSSLESF